MRAGFLCPKCNNFACLHTRQDQNEFHLKRCSFFCQIGIFCKSIADLLSETKKHWMVNWLQLLSQLNFVCRQGLYAKFVSMMSPKSSIVENDGDFMLMTFHTHFLPQQQYSWVYALFSHFHALVYRWGYQFLSLFSQDNEHTELTVLLLFQNPYGHVLQHYHDFQSNAAIFPSVVQAYIQPYSFGGRIKLVIC